MSRRDHLRRRPGHLARPRVRQGARSPLASAPGCDRLQDRSPSTHGCSSRRSVRTSAPDPRRFHVRRSRPRPSDRASSRSFTSSASSESSTASSCLPARASGRSNGMPFSLTLVQPPCRSGSPQGVFGDVYGLAVAALRSRGSTAAFLRIYDDRCADGNSRHDDADGDSKPGHLRDPPRSQASRTPVALARRSTRRRI